MKPILISLKDLDNIPCKKYYEHIIKEYDKDLFDPIELIKKFGNNYRDVSWLIAIYNFCQTLEMLYYIYTLKKAIDCAIREAQIK